MQEQRPQRSRHSVLGITFVGLAAAAYWFPGEETVEGPTSGTGDHEYTWVSDWMKLKDGWETLGNTHGCIAVDKKGHIYVNTDTDHAIVVFDKDGNYVRDLGTEFKGGLHGMAIVEEKTAAGSQEFLYLTHTAAKVAKRTLDGKEVWTLDGAPEGAHAGDDAKTPIYESRNHYKPTSIAVNPANGDFYVADGYGRSWIHHYDKDRNWIRAFGGPGTDPGKLRTPHGIWFDTRGDKDRILVADRENNRLQYFSLDGEHLGVVKGDLRRPCHAQVQGDDIIVADLAGRVSIIGKDDKLITHLFDNPDPNKRAKNGVPLEQWADEEFLSPHCAAWDANGDLYVMDWNFRGRMTKLQRKK